MSIIVTGAASGIGAATARLLSKRCAGPLVLVDRTQDGLETIAAELAGEVFLLAGDLADAAFCEGVADAAADRFGAVTGLASIAGVTGGAPLVELTATEFDRQIAINARATWAIAKGAYPHMCGRPGRAIVAVASMSATVPTPPLGAYSASKAALVALIQQLAVEWGEQGIRANCVSPGPTRSGITAAAYRDQATLERREQAIPLGRVAAASDIAEAIVFLLSPASQFITGANLVVDGGMSQNLMACAGTATGLARS